MSFFGGYDGSIKIDSRIDSKGFNTGIKSMIGAVGKLAAAIGAAFALRSIVNFGKTAVDAASDMASALIGLQSVVEGTGNNFSKAQEFINSFVADGLIPAKDAITAYKNLLLRGYDTSQIEKTLTALKDSAAFGRQGSLSIGEAVRGATEGLKNENSILVDNAGVTKNVSMMWKDYAEKIGTTVDQLTKAQKIQAEVAGIMEETRFQTGDAAKAANTYAGQVSALGVSFLNLKIAIGNVLIPIVQKILPVIRAVVDGLTVMFNRLATVVKIFFGVDLSQQASQMGAVADSTTAAADAQGELADNTTKAGKAAKGALAAFDQLDVLQRGATEPAGTGTGAGIATPAIDTTVTDSSLNALTEKVLAWKEKLLELLAPAIAAFGRLVEALKPLWETIKIGLGWIWENILVPFGKWVLTSFIPAFFDLLAAGARVLNAALIILGPALEWLWNHIFKQIAVGALNLIIQLMKQFTNNLNTVAGWLEAHPDLFANIAANAKIAWDNIRQFILNAWLGMVAIWQNAGTWFASAVINPIRNWFVNLVNWLMSTWQTFFNWLPNGWQSAFNAVVSIVSGAINRVISIVTNAINTIAAGINNILNMINSIRMPSLDFGGGGIFGGIRLFGNIPLVPYLASGAVIPPNSQFLAMLGDQTNGRNIEAPEGLIRQIIREEIGNIKADIQLEFTGSLASLARELRPEIVRENVRVGNHFIK